MIWHSEPLENIVNTLNTDTEKGLQNGVAEQRLTAYGSNSLSFGKPSTFLQRFVAQLNNFPTIALLVVAVISFIVTLITKDGHIFSPILIFTIVLLNTAISAYEDIRTEDTADVLKDYAAPTATVIREGKERIVDASELVPGDIIVLNEGDYICADARLLTAKALCCDEAALTASHAPADKVAETLLEDITPLSERINMVYSGCSVTHGSGTAIVVATGTESEIGKENIILNQSGENRLAIKDNIAAFGKTFSLLVLAVCALVFILGMLFNLNSSEGISRTLINTFLDSMALAVAIIPEALPTAIVVILSLGMGRLVTKNVVVKDVGSVEKMGGISVICSDKTGTLTQNNMTVSKIFNGREIIDINETQPDDIKMILELATICNDSTETSGDPTGMGIAEACKNICGMGKQDIENLYPRLTEVPFDSERKLMTTVNMINGKPFAIVKGAPENLLPLCKGNPTEKFTPVIESLAGEALRVIAVAAKQVAEIPANPNAAELECDLNFIGFIGLADSPRPEAVRAVLECKKAGIRTIMITGDYPATAKAFARRLGILTDDTEMLTNVELAEMSDEELSENIEKYSVYARISSLDRLRIVRAWQSKGHSVAVTGDSVDDTPALMAADVGCAMGKNGTDVANGVADIILTDDDFSSIVNSVKEGRAIFSNIRKVLTYLIGSNLGEILFVLFGVLIFGKIPLMAAPLLFINLLTDILPVLAIGMEPPEKAVMHSPPQKKQTVFSKRLVVDSLYQGVLFTVISIIAYAIGLPHGKDAATTLAFLVIILSQVIFSLSTRCEHAPSLMSLGSNKFALLTAAFSILLTAVVVFSPLGSAFGFALAIPGGAVVATVFLSLIPFAVCEATKLIHYLKTK